MILFEWDPKKSAINFRKHGVKFSDAVLAFDDENALIAKDQAVDGEERLKALGLVRGVLVLAVIHTYWVEGLYDEEEIIRIISARPATPSERRRYQMGAYDHR